jgi:calcineurin-like phosphoesterase family protein
MTIFLIADNHFGSKEVIETFHRPFRNVGEMNRVMIENWNRVVKQEDLVFVLGDFTWEPTRRYADQLAGNKVFIRGNHDWGVHAGGHDLILEHQEKKFYLVHDPDETPRGWNGWTIHGHHHWMDEYPFIDPKWKTINVACEVVNYTPVSLDWILSLDLEKATQIKTVANI